MHRALRALKSIRWMLFFVLVMALGLALAASSLTDAITPKSLRGYHNDRKWVSVSNGEPEASVGLRWFTRDQIDRLADLFPRLGLIAASVTSEYDVTADNAPQRANIQFVKPDVFSVAGVRISGRVITSAESFCVPSERWLRRIGRDAAVLGIGGTKVRVFGSVEPDFLMFAGISAVDIWCSWDLAAGTLLPGVSDSASGGYPLYWLYVGATSENDLMEWRARSQKVDLPRVMGYGTAEHRLVSIQGLVNHPTIHEKALRRLAAIRWLANAFLTFGFLLTAFVAHQQIRVGRSQLAVRYALGAQAIQLIRPVLVAHAVTLALALPAGALLAHALVGLMWMDGDLAEARFSGGSVVHANVLPALELTAALALLSLLIESVFVLRLAKVSRFDVTAKAALMGEKGSRMATASLATFMFMSSWALMSQSISVRAPSGTEFGLQPAVHVITPIFNQGTEFSARAVKGVELEQIARAASAVLPSSRLFFIENYPGESGAMFPGALRAADGSDCGVAGEVLRGSSSMLHALGATVLAGSVPEDSNDIVLSRSRALRCFGSIERALGSQISFQGRRIAVSGVFEDFDWNLGSGLRSDFVMTMSELPLAYYGVAVGPNSPLNLKQIFLSQLKAVQAHIVDVLVDDMDAISASLHRQEVAQARALATLASLLAIGCIGAIAGLYTVTFGEMRGVLALRLALGASTGRLTAQVLMPVLAISAAVVALLVALRLLLGGKLEAVSSVIPMGTVPCITAILLTLTVTLGLAGWRLIRTLREPRLSQALYGA